MALKQSKLKQIPLRNKDVAFGYVRESEKANKTSVPEMIKYLCLLFLNSNKDKCDPDHTSTHLKIEEHSIVQIHAEYQSDNASTFLVNEVSARFNIASNRNLHGHW